MPTVERAAPQANILIGDVVLGESPRWRDNRLWFSDWGARQLIAVDLEGRREVILRLPAFPFCFDWLPSGELLIANERHILRLKPDGALSTYAELGGLSDKAWNEIVVDGRGAAYVNNIGFDFPGGAFKPGIVAVVTPDGKTRQVADGVAFPNGMAVTPDNATLIVAESYGKKLTAFDISADGGLSNRRVWADLGDGVPDGIALDAEGAVWYADVPNKRCVRVREGGEVLETIILDRGCFSCALGGPDGPDAIHGRGRMARDNGRS
ncbi:MAG TPA: SMP-30/gluconolactonase/LRE family protein [Roseiarcus sp.]|nr:SMP-30/gluconolactonase/LRE family protein [Roseiarcus sp.]